MIRWFLTAALLCGCTTTPCDAALDQVETCGFSKIELTTAGEECGTEAACQAGCVTDASCDEIGDVLEGRTNELSDCVKQCSE